MIPGIGLVIGAYVILRSVDLLCSFQKRYTGKFARIIVPICCAVTIALAVDLVFGLVVIHNAALSTLQLSNDPASIDALIREGHVGH